MKISKKAAILSATYMIAAMMTLGGFIVKEHARAESYSRSVLVNYRHAFSELGAGINSINTTLQKSLYAASPTMRSSICAEVYAKAMSAQMALGVLPYSNIELEHMASYLSKLGDYACSLLKTAVSGQDYTDEQYAALTSFSQSANQISAALSELEARLLSGELSFQELEKAQHSMSSGENAMVDTGLAGGIKQIETEFPEIPTLVYDGPFSEHITGMTPKFLEGKKEVLEEDAVVIASSFCGIPKEKLRVDYTRDNEIPVYVVSGSDRDGSVSLEITRQGGYVQYFGNSRSIYASRISTEKAIKAAEDFLEARKIDSMTMTYWSQDMSTLTVNFSHTENDVICYPDLVKVSVAMDTGDIVGFESLGYIMSHTARTIPDSILSEEEARTKVSSCLTVDSHNLAIIPTAGKNEVFCHEFKCRDQNNRSCLVYINALTGAEEKILILLEDENGTLTI